MNGRLCESLDLVAVAPMNLDSKKKKRPTMLVLIKSTNYHAPFLLRLFETATIRVMLLSPPEI